MFEIGELVRWRTPLEADYSYGTILDIKRNLATLEGSGYYKGKITEVNLRYIEKLERGGKGFGGCKKYCK